MTSYQKLVLAIRNLLLLLLLHNLLKDLLLQQQVILHPRQITVAVVQQFNFIQGKIKQI